MSPPSLGARAGSLLVGAAAVVAAGVYLRLDPAGTLRPDALLTFARAAAPALFAVYAAIGVGGAVFRATAPALLEGKGGWLAALGLGVAIQGAAMGVFAAFGMIGPASAAIVLLGTAAAWLTRPAVRLPRPGTAVWLVGAVLLLPALFEALAPPTDTDELSYQLALPRVMAEGGHLVGGFFHPDGSRPLPVHLVFAALYALGGEAGPRLWCLVISAALALGVRALAEARFGPGRGDLPALALLGSFSWLREAGLAYNDHIVALWLLLAAAAALERRWIWMGWFAGFALAGKYTAAPAVAALALIAAWDGLRVTPARIGLAAAATLAPVTPWLLRNVASGLHPLFPFAGWPHADEFVFVYPEKYGLGRDLAATLLLPWNVLMRAEITSFAFLGRVSLLWGAIGVAALWAARRDPAVRRLVFIAAVGVAGWAAGAQILRYLLPLFGIAALAGGALPRRWPAWLLLFVSLPSNLAPMIGRAVDRAAVVSGNESPDTFLEREMPAWRALRYLREDAPADAEVALLFAWQGYWVRQPWMLGSVEDHVPTRYWLWEHGDTSIADLRALGVTWLLVGDVHFLKKSYAFLSPDVLKSQFTEPEATLRRLLLRDATRMYAADKWEVWRLDAPGLDEPAVTP